MTTKKNAPHKTHALTHERNTVNETKAEKIADPAASRSGVKKILIFGGKGGVGKSSIATSTAVWLADQMPDKRILLISFDVAHNLGDILDMEIGSRLTNVTENLTAIEPDPDRFARKYARELQDKMTQFVKNSIFIQKLDGLKQFFLKMFDPQNLPLGQKNALFFNQLLEGEIEGRPETGFDYIVADFPPTANMIALFEAPMEQDHQFVRFALDAFRAIHEKFVKVESIYRILHPISSRRVEKNNDDLTQEVFDCMNRLDEKTARTARVLKALGSIRLVSIAEKASVEEAKRAYDLANSYVPVDGLHVNRMIPGKLEGSMDFLDAMITMQRKYLSQARDFCQSKGIGTFSSHLLDGEPIGMDGIRRLGEEIYGDVRISEMLEPKVRAHVRSAGKKLKMKEGRKNAEVEAEL
ncbi:MAG TPA: ArsA-related P-loop ATPase [Patescibacteria group bacterium]|nr:ArsA-related P-loop ATPase [Patescibacteria group bacterium]